MAQKSGRKEYMHDNDEIERLSEQHGVIEDAMGGLLLAPLDLSRAGMRILDSGTADGMSLKLLRPCVL